MKKVATTKVALTIGHRKKSQGAVGNAGVSEYRYYKDTFVPALQKKLKRFDKVETKVFTRGDYGKSYTSRIRKVHKKIDDFGAEYAISFHFDAAANPRAQGHTVLFDSASKQSRSMALVFDAMLDKHLHNRDRGLLDRHSGHGSAWLRYGKSTNILLELYFAAHQKKYMSGTEGFENAINAVAEGILALAGETTIAEPIRFYFSKRSLKRLEATNEPDYIKVMKEAIKHSKVDITIRKDGTYAEWPRPTAGGSAEIVRAIRKASRILWG